MSSIEIRGLQKPNGERYLSKNSLIIWMQQEIISLKELQLESMTDETMNTAKVKSMITYAETQLEMLEKF